MGAMSSPSGDGGARAPRVPVSMRVQVRFGTLAEFVAEQAVNLSTSGIFVRTDEPRKVGSMVYLHIALEEGSKLIEGFGRVARLGEDEEGRRGMGIQFISLDDESTALIERIVGEREGGR